MRYAMRHVTSYSYTQPVVTSFHRLHLTPLSQLGQMTLQHQVIITRPHAGPGENSELLVDAHVTKRIDYLGNNTGRVELIRPYISLAITAWSLVDVTRQTLDHTQASAIIGDQSPEASVTEFCFNSTHIKRHADLADYAADIFFLR